MTGERRQRVAAYALAIDERDRVLVVQAGPDDSNLWFLPGGGVEFGEQPTECVRREVLEETGQVVDSLVLAGVLSDTSRDLHSIRIIYRATLASDAELRAEVDGSTVGARWVPVESAVELNLAPFVRAALGRVVAGPGRFA